ncbi:Phosphatidate phosphatase APP1 [Colletotrichum spinosum]|uniref:Phosphatidate phosphatase APP1 n=1 Tax=Colletotrichum spinosum TaxID=1347390 RepID=A0A4R8Q302_9PEZI|nr:Phosphatidate phosphatase APP1 [Colletotrichum spinosum]
MPTWSEYTGYGGGSSNASGNSNGNEYGAATNDPATPSDRGSRRRWLAAKAGSMYRAGAVAMNEIREGYAQTRVRPLEPEDGQPRTTIPGSFPGVAITVQGDDQMVIFPSYAKRHVKQEWGEEFVHQNQNQNPDQDQVPQGSIRDEEYWRKEWERAEDEKAIVDIDVRGWIYSPHKGPMTRRNRILIGLARQLSGIPAPRQDAPQTETLSALHQSHEERREQEKIAKEAAEIEKRGQEERRVAYRGGFSEAPKEESDDENGSIYAARSRSRSGTRIPMTTPGSPKIPARQNTTGNDLTEAELSVANANLMARIAPFMTTPLVQLPITIFFYNDEKSASRTVYTNDAGHFVIRAALDFVPTNVRVLANESLSATQEVKIIEPRGVSLISDIDDTIKRSNISGGAKEIFRNTFIRELKDLTIEGVREWYNELHAMGVSIHYCSNSPWQLFPVLASYFMIAGLPPGSLHLKQYSGMLQGIFEPVAERKKSTLTRLMKDFPERKFLLVGDSGEADLEVYTELVDAHPGRIIAVFIRDVTTPEKNGYFDSSFEGTPTRQKIPATRLQAKADEPASRPGLPPRGQAKTVGPVMGNLIDFSDEPEETTLDDAAALEQLKAQAKPNSSTTDLVIRKPPPPRPSKPVALRSAPSDSKVPTLGTKSNVAPPVASRSRKPSADRAAPHPLSQIHNASQQTVSSTNASQQTTSSTHNPPKVAKIPAAAQNATSKTAKVPPPPPPPRRRDTQASSRNLSPRAMDRRRQSSNDDIDFEALPPSAGPQPPAFAKAKSGSLKSGATSPTLGSPTLGPTYPNRKHELWMRRLQRAQEILESHGVALYTWRRGHDVVAEAVGMVQEELLKVGKGEKDAKRDGKRFEAQLKREKQQQQQQQQQRRQ